MGFWRIGSNSGVKPLFDKFVRNEFGQPKAGPEGVRAGIARAISPGVPAVNFCVVVVRRNGGLECL